MAQATDDDETPLPPRRSLWARLREVLSGPSVSAPAPERIGRYRVLGRLGEGGMGVVYEVLDESLGRHVALKTIREPDPSARKRFRREARAAASVNHPNVCQLFEIGEEGGRLFIAMELLSGSTLADRLRDGALPPGEVVTIGRDVLAALAALHAAGVVHRDLKPSNVFLTPHGVKLLDFGLARPLPTELTRTLDQGTELTQPGVLVGTPRYMAPEQIRGQEVDERTDLFAAGTLLYEALAGRPAFVGTTMVEVLSATLHESPPALTGSPAVVSLDRVLRRALAKKPTERFSSAGEMARELAAVPLDDGAASGPARPLTRLVVLPFRLLNPDPEIEFLAFTLADAVTGSLAGLPSLVVRSTAAAARLAGEVPDVREIAAGAEVDRVVMGTLLRAGDRLRLASQLVEAPSGTLVSSFTTESPVGDVFRLQDELAERLVGALSLTLAGREARRDVPATARAYELFLRGNEAVRDWADVRIARDLYEQCVREDPGYAPGWARLARCHRLVGKYHLEEPALNVARAEAALRRALELDPDLPLAHKIYAHLEAEGGRVRNAMARLIGLGRGRGNDPELFAGLVHACRYAGLLDASLAAHREARRLDPHISTSVSYTHWMRADLEAVLTEPGDRDDFELLAFALYALGRTADMATVLSRLPPDPETLVVRLLYEVLHALAQGDHEGAREKLRIAADSHTDPEALFLYGSAQATLGDDEGAASALGRAVSGGFCVPEAFDHPWLAGVRDRADVRALRERAEAEKSEALRVFREAGGPGLLGVPA
jgi:TolB-like protein/Flp pilus assembly protein TadD